MAPHPGRKIKRKIKVHRPTMIGHTEKEGLILPRITPVFLLAASLHAAAAPAHDIQASGFQVDEAKTLLNNATLPIIYERLLREGQSPDQAQAGVRAAIPGNTDFTVIQHQNSTAIITHDPQGKKITVAFDATEGSADRLDNAKFWPTSHPVGGSTHHGYHVAVLKTDSDGQMLIDAVRDRVAQYAMQNDGEASLHITGFSRGGSMALTAGARWMAEGFATGTDGIKLQNIYTFGNPAVGNNDFCDAMKAAALLNDVQITRVITSGDRVTDILTKDSAWYMPSLYDHPGTSYYIGTDKGGTPQFLKDPNPTETAAIRSSAAEIEWHSPEAYHQTIAQFADTPPERAHTAQNKPPPGPAP